MQVEEYTDICRADQLIAVFLAARSELNSLLNTAGETALGEIEKADRCVSVAFDTLLSAEFTKQEDIRKRVDLLIAEISRYGDGNQLLQRITISLRADINAIG